VDMMISPDIFGTLVRQDLLYAQHNQLGPASFDHAMIALRRRPFFLSVTP